jgi:hypothetical protein
VADQQNERKAPWRARVVLIVDGERRSGVLWWIGNDSVMIREPAFPSPNAYRLGCSDDGGSTGENDRNAQAVGQSSDPQGTRVTEPERR